LAPGVAADATGVPVAGTWLGVALDPDPDIRMTSTSTTTMATAPRTRWRRGIRPRRSRTLFTRTTPQEKDPTVPFRNEC
jgi:hypothetical protein